MYETSMMMIGVKSFTLIFNVNDDLTHSILRQFYDTVFPKFFVINASLNCKDLNKITPVTQEVSFIYFTIPTTDNYEFLSFWPNKYF